MKLSGARYRRFMLMAALCAMNVGGCNSLPTSPIDPTGEHVFTRSPAVANPAYPVYQNSTGGYYSGDDVALILTPSETVAPVGSEVVLIAGVGAADGYLRTYRRLEWTIAPGSAGQFVAVGKNDFVDVLLGDFNRTGIVNSTFAVGSTAGKDEQLTRGTLSPADDIFVTRGQGWISVTSPVEGDSYVTVVAPDISPWAARTKTAVIHWVDATWRFPPPAINPAGTKHVFTTTVTHQSNQSPCQGWLVKYTIISGPPAGFSPDGASSVEVTTDAAGQASAEIFQKSPAHGTNQISIEVFRPGQPPAPNGQRMPVGKGSTMKTWTAADIAVDISGPATGAVGATLTYRIDVSNPGDLTSKDVIAGNTVPNGLTYLSSNPPAEAGGDRLQWRLGELGPRQHRTIEINYRGEKEGSVSNCADVSAAGGLKVSDCATTTITAPAAAPAMIDLKLTGPSVARINSDATFEIQVINRGQNAINNLLVKDRFEPGLEHPASKEKRIIEYDLGELGPGRSTKLELTFRVTQAGQLCHTVEVMRQNTILARRTACLTAAAEAAPRPGVTPPGAEPPAGAGPGLGTQPTPGYSPPPTTPSGQTPPAAAGVPTINIKHIAPQIAQGIIGDPVLFNIQIANPNNRPLNNLKVLYYWDPALVPTHTAPECQLEGKNLMWLFPVLAAGTTREIQVQCRCTKAAEKARNIVSVSCAEGAQAEAEAFFTVRSPAGAPAPGAAAPGTGPPKETSPGLIAPGATPAASGLTMTVADLRDPVAASKELTYQITVVNNGNTAQHQVAVSAMVPEGMVPAPLGTTGPGPTQFVINQQTITFNPIMEVQPGETLIYRVRVRTKQAGQFQLRAELNSRELTQPISQEESTKVF